MPSANLESLVGPRRLRSSATHNEWRLRDVLYRTPRDDTKPSSINKLYIGTLVTYTTECDRPADAQTQGGRPVATSG